MKIDSVVLGAYDQQLSSLEVLNFVPNSSPNCTFKTDCLTKCLHLFHWSPNWAEMMRRKFFEASSHRRRPSIISFRVRISKSHTMDPILSRNSTKSTSFFVTSTHRFTQVRWCVLTYRMDSAQWARVSSRSTRGKAVLTGSVDKSQSMSGRGISAWSLRKIFQQSAVRISQVQQRWPWY